MTAQPLNHCDASSSSAPTPRRGLVGVPTIVLLLAGLIALAAWRISVWPGDHAFRPRVPLDLWIYTQAGAEVHRGGDLYDNAYYGDLPFTYPPFSGLLFTWLSHLSDWALTIAWQSATGLALWVVILLVLRERGVKLGPWSWIIAVLLTGTAIWTEPIHGTLFFGQINVFLMLLVSLDFLAGRRSLPGIGTGLAAGMKLTPAFFGLLFLAQRRWGAVAGCLAGFLFTMALGFFFIPDAMTFWTDAMFNSGRVGAHTNPGAQSLRSVLIRVLDVHDTTVWLALCALVVVLTVLAIRTALRHHNYSAAVAFTGISSCLISPFSWYHHWVWVIPLGVSVLVTVNQGIGKRMHSWVGRQLTGLLSVAAMAVVMAPYITGVIWYTVSYKHLDDISFGQPWLTLLFSGSGLVYLLFYAAWGFIGEPRNHAVLADAPLSPSPADPAGPAV